MSILLLCSFEFSPQIVGGVIPELETVNESMRHLEAVDTDLVPEADGTPFNNFVSDIVAVDGPVIMNISKSSLN